MANRISVLDPSLFTDELRNYISVLYVQQQWDHSTQTNTVKYYPSRLCSDLIPSDDLRYDLVLGDFYCADLPEGVD